MKHSVLEVQIATDHNKFNSNQPLRIQASGAIRNDMYYNMESAYLRMSVRTQFSNFENLIISSTAEVVSNINGLYIDKDYVTSSASEVGIIYVPTYNYSPVDYVDGLFSIMSDNGEEIQYTLNNINIEDAAEHNTILNVINTPPNDFELYRHRKKMYNGMKGFKMQNEESNHTPDTYGSVRRFDNSIKFMKKSDGYWYADMFISFKDIIEMSSRQSLLRMKLIDFYLHWRDANKYFNFKTPSLVEDEDFYESERCSTIDKGYLNGNNVKYDVDQIRAGSTFINKVDHTNPEIMDCTLYIDQFEVDSFEELAKYGSVNNVVLHQVDNHVYDWNKSASVNKFKICCPFKPMSCYYYFTVDDDVSTSYRTDTLYMNPPKYVNFKTISGYVTEFPYYSNDTSITLYEPIDVYSKTSYDTYYKPDYRFYEEYCYTTNKFAEPIITYDEWCKIHRIYSIDMFTHLDMNDGPQEFYLEIAFEESIPSTRNVKLHVFFEKYYD